MQHTLNVFLGYMMKILHVIAKLFSFLKSSKQDQLDTPALNLRDRLVTETAEKADLHNLQFQSVFTTKAPLSLSRLCKVKLQGMADCGGIPSEALPPWDAGSSPVMEDFDISLDGILKLLKNLKLEKLPARIDSNQSR